MPIFSLGNNYIVSSLLGLTRYGTGRGRDANSTCFATHILPWRRTSGEWSSQLNILSSFIHFFRWQGTVSHIDIAARHFPWMDLGPDSIQVHQTSGHTSQSPSKKWCQFSLIPQNCGHSLTPWEQIRGWSCQQKVMVSFPSQGLHLTQKNGSQSPIPGDRLDKFNLLEVTFGRNFVTTSVTTVFCFICMHVPGETLNCRVSLSFPGALHSWEVTKKRLFPT